MSSSKTIAKNTLFLYFRMLINMALSLYTSRVILNALGVEDFGIYNIVAAVVVMFSFLNSAMSAATQRFLNVEIVSKDEIKINNIFSMSLNIHAVIAIIVLLLSETIGLWFLNTKLNIPSERMHAANIVFQLSVITTIVDILRIPYNATLVAFERMSFYALLGFIEILLKLFVVFTLVYFPAYDHLILYAVLLLLVNFIVNALYYGFCKKNFKAIVDYKFRKDVVLFKNMLVFSGWSLMGQVSSVAANQGVNVILNLFVGVVINAALGIANQVSAAIYSFVSNAQIAFNPQIIHTYAEKNIARHINLVLQASRFSFFLITLISFPFLLAMQYVIQLWLGSIYPEYTIILTKLVIASAIISSLAGPLWMSAYAVGNIKRYQFILSTLLLLILPVAYTLLKLGFLPYYVFISKISFDILIFCFRVYYFKSTLAVEVKKIIVYLKSILPIVLVIIFILWLSRNLLINTWPEFLFYTLLGEACVLLLILFIGVSSEERKLLFIFIRNKLHLNKQ